MSQIPQTYEGIRYLIIKEQVVDMCPRDTECISVVVKKVYEKTSVCRNQ